ncbi:hypothetical protein [Ruminococcus sp. zg-924]|uniref:hypothetical protein n=1 Tax=Ruminococcus sp. zg-924 TaxID=2678505 RepID=UPI00210E094E|nr:hypothetical protein [Ruminococcus sp. zg-924]MCQ4023270.1 hypothetical protein [Ruminococcus sp. zg-924]
MKRTIKKLLKENCRVYVYLSDKDVAKRFLQHAENEGFTFGDGAKPTSGECDSIMAVNENATINYVGVAGRIAFGCAEKIGDKKLMRVDYNKYISGDENYIMNRNLGNADV